MPGVLSWSHSREQSVCSRHSEPFLRMLTDGLVKGGVCHTRVLHAKEDITFSLVSNKYFMGSNLGIV